MESRYLFSQVGLFLYIIMHSSQGRDYCYRPTFVKTNWSDSPPRYIVKMNFSNEAGAFSIQNTVNEVIKYPVTRMMLSQRMGKGPENVLYNATTKLCELRQLVGRMPMFHAIAQTVLKSSNYTFTCPMQKGVYIISEFKVKSRNSFLAMMYHPKKFVTLSGGMFEELPDKSLGKLNVYEIVMKIVKKPC